MHNMKHLWAISVLLFLIPAARADQTWTYAGNATGEQGPLFAPPNPCDCALSGSVTLDNALSPIAWSFTDGFVTLNQTDSTAIIDTQIYAIGLFSNWFIAITGANGSYILTEYYGSQYEATDGGSGGLYVQGNHGVWTEAVAAPEPGTLALLGAGLVGLFARRRSKGILAA